MVSIEYDRYKELKDEASFGRCKKMNELEDKMFTYTLSSIGSGIISLLATLKCVGIIYNSTANNTFYKNPALYMALGITGLFGGLTYSFLKKERKMSAEQISLLRRNIEEMNDP